MDRKKAEYELGRYKHKVESLEKELAAAKEQAAGYREVLDVNSALIAAMLKHLGNDAGNPLELKREEVSEAVRKYIAASSVSEAQDAYYLCFMEKEN